MKAVLFKSINTPFEVVERPIPDPQAGQVLIKIKACGICGTDLHVQDGILPVKAPCTMGHEPVGEVVKLGPGVTHLKIGDRVGVSWVQDGCGRCGYCQSKNEKYCTAGPISWAQNGGGLAEYLVASEKGCTLLPDSLSYELAAPMFCAGYTVASGFHNARPYPGETVAVLGFGGLGHLASQYAKAKGHKTIVLTRTKGKEALAKQLGIDHVVILDESASMNIAKLGGIDILLHTGQSSALVSSLIPLMNPEGRIVIMGLDREPIKVDPLHLIHKQLKIIGSQQNRRSDLVDILRLVSEKKITPMVEVFPFTDLQTALKKVTDGSIRFRAVIKFD